MALENSAPDAAAYRVLARKYRPKTFADLIGQDGLVRTLTNAFATGRIAQAYMLTGVRGVGKTTTARLIARALNYPSGASIDMPEITPQCEAILESRHMDVIEMDAASNTGVDNIREIIDQVKYAPTALRTKVYIVDEVHMLSKNAFNALLKTLEEPPPHVKFIFATTEIRKVPVTILSRCQRFDLKRLDAALLMQHYGRIAALEEVQVEEEALRLIARAAEGSVRDGLSLLDQAIAYGSGAVIAADVANMLGLADRTKVIDLFETVMRGDAAAALQHVKTQFDAGTDPETILTDLADFTHWVTRLRVSKESALMDGIRSGEEKTRGVALAEQLGVPALSRAWQMLLKGIAETTASQQPLAAAEMVVIRLCHAANLPQGADLVQSIQKAGPPPSRPNVQTVDFRKTPADQGSGPAVEGNLAPAVEKAGPQVPYQPAAADAPFANFTDVLNFVREKRDIKLVTELETYARPVRISAGKIELALEPGAATTLPGELARKLEMWTQKRWIVAVAKAGGAEPVARSRKAARDETLKQATGHPDVQAIMKRFPGATIVEVRQSDTTPSTEETDEEPV